jgi:N-acetylgalactosamine-6-sulfatase
MTRTTRRDWLIAAGAAPAVLRASARRPSIVLLLADDLGSRDLSSYGSPDIRTPNIDGIGRRGVRFTRFYANAPECSPTRTALLTGRYQHRVGGLECAIGVGDQGRYDEAIWLQKRGELGLPATEITLPRILKDAGYDTGCFGKWHLGYPKKFWPAAHGFDESFGILGGNADYFKHTEEDGRQVLYQNHSLTARTGYTTDLFAEAAIGWLKGRGERPFFLYLPFNAPHTPIQDPDGFDPQLGTAPARNRDRKVYAKMVERMDAGVGAVLAQLDRMGRAEDTIVIFLSDNGGDPNGDNEPLRGRKSSVWEGGIRVPCLLRWPRLGIEGRENDQVGLTMDLLPTLLAAAGIAPPGGRKFDGANLLPVIQGRRSKFDRTVFWRYRRAEATRKAVRAGDWKLVDDNGARELHDLAADPLEQRDLLAARPEQAARLQALLAAWEKDVRAPRLASYHAGS